MDGRAKVSLYLSIYLFDLTFMSLSIWFLEDKFKYMSMKLNYIPKCGTAINCPYDFLTLNRKLSKIISFGFRFSNIRSMLLRAHPISFAS